MTLTPQLLEHYRELARAARFKTVDAPGLVQLTGDELLALVDAAAAADPFDVVTHALRASGCARLCVRPTYFIAFPAVGVGDAVASSLRQVLQALKTEITERKAAP